jgi:hypothetical protein
MVDTGAAPGLIGRDPAKIAPRSPGKVRSRLAATRRSIMASSRFIDRSARVLWSRVIERRRAERRWLARLSGMVTGLALAGAAFFALKGAAMASGTALPMVEGWALWLAGPDPLSVAVGQILQPVFGGRV